MVPMLVRRRSQLGEDWLQGGVDPQLGERLLQRVAPGTGFPIEVEVWAMPVEHFGSFVKLIGSPLGIGTLRLQDGADVKGFICEPIGFEGAEDISSHGGWRAYLAQK